MEKQENSPNPEKILIKNAHIRGIDLPTPTSLMYKNYPIETKFSEALDHINLQLEFKRLLPKSFVGYLKAPIIIDDFADDNPRDDFENSFYDKEREVFEFYRSNRLRRSNISDILRMSDYLIVLDVFKRDEIEDLLEPLRNEISEWNEEDREQKDNFLKYESMNEDEKIAITEKVAELARKIITLIIEKYPNKP